MTATTGAGVQAVVIVAMADEAAPFLELAGVTGGVAPGEGIVPDDAAPAETGAGVSQAVGAAEHTIVELGGRRVALVRSGIGFVNAAGAAVGALLTYGTVPVISAGSAGGLDASVAVGDVVVGRTYVNTGADATAFGYRLGQVPGMPAVYAADPGLLEAASAAGAGQDQKVLAGTIGSSEQFVTTSLAETLRVAFDQVLAVDMESAAIAQACHNHGAPFVAIRGVSDLCAPDGTEFLTHVDDAALRSARVVTAALAGL
ncbi:5'-methylthioadenosine/S-adenosylhomocysteine nucleosidase [Myceligenerans crystallogenes]|uniref:adenosylhomocysteine nucleosidase n=1 Tax=Myceligenerans crystallogenes TaxID=316335 RepID=A0ABN2NIU9_9MICO